MLPSRAHDHVATVSALPDLAGGAFPTRDLLTWLTNLGHSNYVQPPPLPPPK